MNRSPASQNFPSDDQCYAALIARDRRFDGRFYTGVSSTRIFCRPVCKAVKPKRENVRFFASASQAQQAGFRPCLRCRPECAPGQSRGMDTDDLCSRASRLIESGFLDSQSVPQLANKLNVSERQLRRAMQQELGLSPVEFAKTRRLLNARKLLLETDASLVDIALMSGFGSLRSLNAAFHASYADTPSSLRSRKNRPKAAKKPPQADPGVSFSLGYRPPYDWQQVLSFFQLRCIQGVEKVINDEYLRYVSVPTRNGLVSGWIRIQNQPEQAALRIHCEPDLMPAISQLIPQLRRVFDLDADPQSIATHFRQHAPLAELITQWPGQRIPGVWSAFEGGIRAILGQQVTVNAAIKLTTQFVHATSGHAEDGQAFPTAEKVTETAIDSLRMPQSRKRALSTLTQWFVDNGTTIEGMPLPQLRKELLNLHGIGPWTVDYLTLRALGNPDIFPSGDIVLRKHSQPGITLSPAAMGRMAEPWAPWRGYATVLIWRAANLSN